MLKYALGDLFCHFFKMSLDERLDNVGLHRQFPLFPLLFGACVKVFPDAGHQQLESGKNQELLAAGCLGLRQRLDDSLLGSGIASALLP